MLTAHACTYKMLTFSRHLHSVFHRRHPDVAGRPDRQDPDYERVAFHQTVRGGNHRMGGKTYPAPGKDYSLNTHHV